MDRDEHQKVMLSQQISLAYTHNLENARIWAKRGYEGIECAFGKEDSVVGEYILDHHGKFSTEEPVSIKAARLAESGVRLDTFLVTGLPDPDAIYAILCLSGNIQAHKNIAASIAELDIDPIGIERMKEPHIRNPYFEMLLGSPKRNLKGYIHALNVGITAFAPKPIDSKIYSEIFLYEKKRLAHASQEIKTIEGDFGFVVSNSILDTLHFEKASVIVQYKPHAQKVTIRACTRRAAERLGKKNVYEIFGSKGLHVVYELMDDILGKGSGGREDIGGSAQDLFVSRAEAFRVFQALKSVSL